MTEHVMEKKFNKTFWKNYNLYNHTTDHEYVKDFLTRLNEKKQKISQAILRKQYYAVCNLLKRFPNVDEEALKARFPNVDIEQAKKDELSRGHHSNLY